MSHRRITSKRYLLVGAVIMATPLLTGCVVGEIRDEMKAANANLEPLKSQIATGNEMLSLLAKRVEQVEHANALLEEGNEQLRLVADQLEVMESIQASLTSIDTSLKHLDDHLASLRSTIDNIDSTIPFLKISGDEEADQTVAEDPSDQPNDE